MLFQEIIKMNVAKFTHVSQAQYAEAMTGREGFLPVAEIPLPKRATAGSAGYDFVSPVEVTVEPGETALIPTGIRAETRDILWSNSAIRFPCR